MTHHDDVSEHSENPSRRRVLAATGAIGVGLLAGCSGDGTDSDGGDSDADSGGGDSGGTDDGSTDDGSTDDGSTDDGSMDDGSTDGESGDSEGSGGGWQTTELTDVLTGETFSIQGLEGPVAVQSFAVWCPKCQRQSKKLSNVDDSVTVVGLNIDPNEDAEKVRQHAESNGFDWRFAVAPTEMTESLVEEFGTTVTNAPSTPIILACPDGDAEFFSGSQQSAAEIESAAGEC